MDQPPLFHGTKAGFRPGGYLFPPRFTGHEPRAGAQGEDSLEFVYVTTDWEQAEWYAVNSKGRGRPKVLTVVPTDVLEVDPSTYDGERGEQLRTKGQCRVVKVEAV